MKKIRNRKKIGGQTVQKRSDSAQNANDKEIAYQNKDIASKMLAESLKGKSFRVYGLDIPEIKAVLPTNIPAVKANELRLDNLFELMDNTLAIVDYESEYREADKIKYLNYLTGIANRYRKEQTNCPILRMIVIYTGDIERKQVSEEYNIGAVRVTMEAAFLSELDSVGTFRRLKNKVEKKELLNDTELMQFIILPLSYRKKEEKEEKVRETVALAAQIQDRDQQLFTLAGILTFTDKLIDDETANKIRRAIEMTKVARIFEEEKQQALDRLIEESRQALAKAEEENRQALAKAEEENRRVLADAEAEKQQALAKAEEENRQALAKAEEENQRALAKAEEENRQALAKAEEENRQALADAEAEKQQALAKAEEEKRESVIKMIRKNYSTEEIASIISGYTQDGIEALRREITVTGGMPVLQ